ncbi:protein phosphatase 1D [Anthonomus grandis grandis]|uniref:protein phosphatase 1D n=1 Tax=Anthonomus grandis grandis TaxID=2921223 RepID=UPI002165258B|nr:protein phosphatase 1D [Anthonomus grandis grandis]
MPASIGVNLRVTGNCRQGGRKYMEDSFSVAYQQTEDEKDLEYAFFGIYDGHGGVEAASFAKEHLMETIIKHKNFWSDNDEEVLRAIRDGYIATHYAMWREQSKWPKTSSGLPSTAGTTASVAFIRRGKIYIGHVGDSGIILGYQEPGTSEWKAKPLTKDHKPETPEEMRRIESSGGKVVSKSGVPRVVWNRPKIGHQGPVRRSTPIDEIPFLAVARSLGDLWSYNSQNNQFVVSPDPDCSVMAIDTNVHRCLIFGTDGLFNMLSPSMAVHIVQQAERHNECEALSDDYNKVWLNPSKLLVEKALERWHATKMRADNTSAVTLMLDPPGPPRAQVLKDRKKNLPESGLKIVTRCDVNTSQSNKPEETSVVQVDSVVPQKLPEVNAKPEVTLKEKSAIEEEALPKDQCTSHDSITSTNVISIDPVRKQCTLKLRDSAYFTENIDEEAKREKPVDDDNTIQINEISSSNIEADEETNDDESCIKNKKNPEALPEKKQAPTKRKFVEPEAQQQRKSVRLSLTQKFLAEPKGPAPCTLAEEKLKKLAEEAEKSRKSSVQVQPDDDKHKNKRDRKFFAQKIRLKTKKAAALKQKTSSVKAQLTKRKKLKNALGMVMHVGKGEGVAADRLLRSQENGRGETVKARVAALEENVSNVKRQSLRTASVRSKEPPADKKKNSRSRTAEGKLQVLNSNRGETKKTPYAANLRSSRGPSDIKNEAKENIKGATFKGVVGKVSISRKTAKRRAVAKLLLLHQKVPQSDKSKSVKKRSR